MKKISLVFFNIPYANKQNMGKWSFRMAGSMPVKVKYGKFCAIVYIMQKYKEPQ